jgi:hypothetical protein
MTHIMCFEIMWPVAVPPFMGDSGLDYIGLAKRLHRVMPNSDKFLVNQAIPRLSHTRLSNKL